MHAHKTDTNTSTRQGYHRDRVVEKMDEVQKMKARRVAIEKEMQTLTEELQRVIEADQEEFSKTRGLSGRAQ